MARRFSFLIILSLALASVLGSAACENSNIPLIAIQVAPLCVVVPPGGTQAFTATIFVDSVDQGVDNGAVNWSVLGGDVNGVIDENGNYTAPNTNPPPVAQATIIATSKEDDQKQNGATAVLSGSCPAVPPPSQSF